MREDLDEYKKGYDKRVQIYNELEKERLSQNTIWGEQNHSPLEFMAILMEEVGEASKEAVDFHFCNPVKIQEVSGGKSRLIRVDANSEDQKERLLRYRKELIQVAAVAIQMIESLDRNELQT